MVDSIFGDSIIYIADKLEMPVTHIYEVIVQAQLLLAILDLIEVVLTVIAYAISVILIRRYMIKCHNERYATKQYREEPDIMVITFMSIVLSLLPTIFMLIVAGYIGNVIIAFYMPEYAAIHKIASMLGLGL